MIRRRLRSATASDEASSARESGQALLLVIIVMAALTISIGGLIKVTGSSEASASHGHQGQRSLDLAEAGLSDAIATITKQDFNNSQLVGTNFNTTATPTSLDHGAYTYTATKSCPSPCGATSSKVWTITSTGTGQTGIVHQLQTTLTAAQADAFDFGFFIADASGCTTTAGTADLEVSVWIQGDYCPNGNSSIVNPDLVAAHKVTVYIGGDYNGGNNNTIGTAPNPVLSVDVVGICKTHAAVCSAADKVWAGTYSKSPESISKPPIYPDVVYAGANWTSPSCSVGSFVFDNNSTRDTSLNSVNLTPSTYDCIVTNSTGTQVGRISYSTSTKVLAITGTIFIDGNLNLTDFKYTGSGSIYVNGTVSGGSKTQVCGPPAGTCSAGGWDPTVGSLLIAAANANNAATGFNVSGGGNQNSWYDIDAYVNGHFDDTGGSAVTGSVIADSGRIAGNAGVVKPGTAPTDAPIEWDLRQGAWSQLR